MNVDFCDVETRNVNAVAIMQPYFFPYIGYYQLISTVNKFVVYDEIKFTKQSWITRNYILDKDGGKIKIGIPLRKGSDFLNINQRIISDSFDYKKILKQIELAYVGAPHFNNSFEFLEEVLGYPDDNLFNFLLNSIKMTASYLDLETEILISSKVEQNKKFKSQERVLGICSDLGAKVYVNPIGGTELYKRNSFSRVGIDLRFLRAKQTPYTQNTEQFEPFLSIIDLLMNLPKSQIIQALKNDIEMS